MSTVTLRIQVDKAGASENIGAVKRDLQGMGETGAQAGAQASTGVNGLSSAINGAKAAVGAFLAVYAGIRTLAGIVNLADEYQGLTDRLRLATGSTVEFAAAQAGVFAIAQSTGSALGAVNDLYVGLSRSTEQLGLSQNDLLTITTAINQSFAVSGTGAAAAEAATRQLGQAFASGVLRGDEFNSMMENAPGLASALAASLGVTTGELRKMAAEGKLTSDVLATGLLQQAGAISDQFGQMGITVGRAFTQLSNAVLKFVGEASQSTGAASALAGAISGIASNIEEIARALGAATVAVGVFLGARGIGALVSVFQAAATSIALTAAPIGSFIVGATGAAAATTTWAVAGRALFTLMGGWVGIVAAAAAGIYYLATAESEAEEAARAADGAIAALAGTTGKLREKAVAALSTQLALNEELLRTKQQFVDGLTDGSTYAAFFGDILAPRVTRAREEVNELGNSILRMRAASAGEWTIVSPTAEAGISALISLMNQFRSSTDLSAEAGRNLATGQAALAGALNGSGTAMEKQGEAGAKLRDKLVELSELEKKFPALAGEINAARGQLLAAYNAEATAVPKLTDAQKELEKSLKDSKAATLGLALDQEKLTAELGGPAVKAAIELAQRLRAVDDREQELRRTGQLSTQTAEALNAMRGQLIASYGREATAVQSLQSPYETYISKLNDERRLLGLSATERARAESQIRAVANVMTFANAQRERGNGLMIEEIEKLILLEQKLDETAAATNKAAQEAQGWQQYWSDAVGAVGDAFGDFVASGFKSFEDLKDGLVNIAKQIVSDLVSTFLRSRITIPITAALTGGPAAAGGLTSGTGSGGFGGLLGSLLGGAGGLLGGGFGTGLLASGSIFSGAGLLGGITGSIGAGFASIAGGSILQGLGLLAGPIGLLGVAITALSSLFGRDKPPDVRFGGEQASIRNREGRFSTVFGGVQAGSRQISYEDMIEPIQQFDLAIQGIVQATGGGADQLNAIKNALATWEVDLRGSAATAENVLGSRFSAILSAFSSDVQGFVGTTGTLEERLSRFTDALSIAAIAAGDNGISGSFEDLADLLTRFRLQGEGVADTFGRLSFGVGLIDDTLLMLGGTFRGTRLQAANFAGELINLAGGLDQFSARLNGALEALFSEPERNQFMADQALAALNSSLRGLNITGTGVDSIREQLRTQLRDALAAGNSALVNELLIAGNALGAFATAVGRLGDTASGALTGTVFGSTPGNAGTIGPGQLNAGAGTAAQTQLGAVQTTNTILNTQTGLLQRIALNTDRGATLTPKAGPEQTAVLVQIKALIEQAVRAQISESLKRTTGANKRTTAA